jgi:hypothetical protein
MDESEKDKLVNKWAPIMGSIGVTGSKSDWLAEYAQNMTMCELSHTDESFPSILPTTMKLSAQTIGMDLVSVSPLPGPGMSSEKYKEIEAEIKQENRDNKIDSLVEGKEYVEKKVEDHPDFVSGPKIDLLYMDFVYGSSSNSSI